MSDTRAFRGTGRKRRLGGIDNLSVNGYKSIWEDRGIAIRPLTILAGPNSSGKSSMMQPLLMLKQTLDAGFDLGPLRLDGPNVKFSSRDQLIPRKKGQTILQVGVGLEGGQRLRLDYEFSSNSEPTLRAMTFPWQKGDFTIWPGMSRAEIEKLPFIPKDYGFLARGREREFSKASWSVVRNRCFLELVFQEDGPGKQFLSKTSLSLEFEFCLRGLIHVPGLRGNPERAYPVTAVGPSFPGTFEPYVASVIDQWQSSGEADKIQALRQSLERLELTWKVEAKRLDDTRLQLRVGRLTHPKQGGARDLVDIADVGFGLSQSLPVLVALQAANSGQLLYIEQPEIHLHPRATHKMAAVLAEAAKRGVRVVVETHSALLLVGIQELVANGTLQPGDVALHWFSRDEAGLTQIVSAELDEAGAFGNWPEDFGKVALEAERSYLDAAEARLTERS